MVNRCWRITNISHYTLEAGREVTESAGQMRCKKLGKRKIHRKKIRFRSQRCQSVGQPVNQNISATTNVVILWLFLWGHQQVVICGFQWKNNCNNFLGSCLSLLICLWFPLKMIPLCSASCLNILFLPKAQQIMEERCCFIGIHYAARCCLPDLD